MIDFASRPPPNFAALKRRVLESLPHLGVCTVRRASYHAGLGKFATRRAVAGLVKDGLVVATRDGRLTLTMYDDALLELTEDGRRAQLETTGQRCDAGL